MTTAIALATGQSPLPKNSLHSTLPTMVVDEPPSMSGMTNSPTAGTNTSNPPAITPGSDSGQVTRQNASLLYSDSPYFTGDQMKPYYNQKDPAKAKALLAAAGYKGEKIIIHTNSVYAYMRAQMLVLEQALKAVGVNVEMRVTDWITNANALTSGDGGWNISMTGYCSQPLLGPQQWRPLIYGHAGLGKISDPDVNTPYDRFFASMDVGARKAGQ